MAEPYQPVACAFHENGVSAQVNVSEANVKRSGRSQSLEFAVLRHLELKLMGNYSLMLGVKQS